MAKILKVTDKTKENVNFFHHGVTFLVSLACKDEVAGWHTFSLFFQQVFHVCVVTLLALLVKEDDERDAAEIEFL